MTGDARATRGGQGFISQAGATYGASCNACATYSAVPSVEVASDVEGFGPALGDEAVRAGTSGVRARCLRRPKNAAGASPPPDACPGRRRGRRRWRILPGRIGHGERAASAGPALGPSAPAPPPSRRRTCGTGKRRRGRRRLHLRPLRRDAAPGRLPRSAAVELLRAVSELPTSQRGSLPACRTRDWALGTRPRTPRVRLGPTGGTALRRCPRRPGGAQRNRETGRGFRSAPLELDAPSLQDLLDRARARAGPVIERIEPAYQRGLASRTPPKDPHPLMVVLHGVEDTLASHRRDDPAHVVLPAVVELHILLGQLERWQHHPLASSLIEGLESEYAHTLIALIVASHLTDISNDVEIVPGQGKSRSADLQIAPLWHSRGRPRSRCRASSWRARN